MRPIAISFVVAALLLLAVALRRLARGKITPGEWLTAAVALLVAFGAPVFVHELTKNDDQSEVHADIDSPSDGAQVSSRKGVTARGSARGLTNDQSLWLLDWDGEDSWSLIKPPWNTTGGARPQSIWGMTATRSRLSRDSR
jgi:hypothetical protein